MKILLTGASGFIGSRLKEIWPQPDQLVSVSLRAGASHVESIDWTKISCVIHLAALAHQTRSIPADRYFEVNHRLTLKLATTAKSNGVRHFIFLSSTKVYGELSYMDEKTPCVPTDPYGHSKLAAEKDLMQLMDSGFTVSIIRSPLVIGPHAKGNLLRLMKLAKLPLPLPLLINNQRSMVCLDNLVAMIRHLAQNPQPGTFLAANQQPISTGELIKHIRRNLDRNPGLFKIPGLERVIKAIKPDLHIRLFGSSVVNNKKSLEELNFTNPQPTQEGIKKMVKSYLSQ